MKHIKSPEQVRIVLKDFTIEEITKIRDAINDFLDERAQALSDAKDKNERLQIFMAQEGISPSSIAFTDKVFKRKPKYVFIDEHGESRTWAGTGRTPTAIKEILDNNPSMTLDDFRIEDDD